MFTWYEFNISLDLNLKSSIMILKTPNLIGDTLDSTAAKLIAYICTTIPVLYQFATYLFKKETFNLTSFIVPVISSVFLLLIFQMCLRI